ncbi:MAG: hypothetical protein AAGC53_14675 [Actinomycetota bacterium]
MLGIRARRFGAVIAVSTLIAAGCGGGAEEDAGDDVVLRTQGDIAVDEDAVADSTTTVAEQAGAAGASESDGGAEAVENASGSDTTTTTTLPQEEVSADEALFDAIGEFQSCLDADGYEFLGLPDPALGEDAPQNQQPYIDALIACAARSQIQQRLAEADAAQDDLTPEEVEEQNRQYVAFRECMIGRGWSIPDPVPNERGLLFPGFAAASQWEGPPGEDIANTDDVGECTSEANVEFGGGS